MSGTLTVVSLGPGNLDQLTPAARQAIEQADCLLGYRTYLNLIADLAPGVAREASGMRQEVQRVASAIERASQGERVVLVSGGDAGIYGLAGLVFEVLQARRLDLPVTVLPGVSALNAAAALLGAPLMSDFAAISLSDQLVPLETILDRLNLAVRADLVLCLYNPQARQRTSPFAEACRVISRHRAPTTPVGIVRAAYRSAQQVTLTTVDDLLKADVDMSTIVIVGNSQTYVYDGRMVTPRGYSSKYDLAKE